jgi:hypothetical protein
MQTAAEKKLITANAEIIERITQSRIVLLAVQPAREVIADFRNCDYLVLHAGPPLEEEKISAVMRGAIAGALVYEDWAGSLEEAEQLMAAGKLAYKSAHSCGALGPMAGIITPSMPMLVVENSTYKNRAFVTINEGLGKTLRFGANGPEVLERLRYIEHSFAPILNEALQNSGPIDITSIMARAMQRGDECHNRNKSATSLFIRKIAPSLALTNSGKEEVAAALRFMDGNDHFFLNLSMAASKATMDKAHEVAGGSLVTCMAANGVEFGIKVCGCGERWFTAPVPRPHGRYFTGCSARQAAPLMGDSYISETMGIGGIALAAAPGIVGFIGGTVREAVRSTRQMYRITAAEHPLFKIPILSFRGTPLGIDVRAVLRENMLPMLNTGIAHRDPGIGQIGAGRVRPPLECFKKAAEALGIHY